MTGKVHEIPQPQSDVAAALQGALEQAGNFRCVIILAEQQDGSQFLQTSTCSGYQKSFLFCFFQAWMAKWFALGEV